MKTIQIKNLVIQIDLDLQSQESVQEQAQSAINQINGVLQREPYGLGAQIFSDDSNIEVINDNRYLSKQTVKFKYQDKDFCFEFTPDEEDSWTAFQQHGMEFDVHYLEDEDNNICVYLVVDGNAQTQNTIHTQKIIL